ncbi:GMC family oxidoreductase N-terminal domain-containing protein [Dankookia sp. P2]|uniref:GMC family oxidoreductase N-terminal domain-containing protein n=1 Tax=Dankookia sp. P2 TaxID=3423955 RepID=UPI003D674D3C
MSAGSTPITTIGAASACTGWSFEDVLPYFKRSEDQERGASDLHGRGGPLAVSDLRDRNPLALAFIEAAAELGFPRIATSTAPSRKAPASSRSRRGTAGAAAARRPTWKPARGRPNLIVVTDAHSNGLVMEGRRAAGVVLHPARREADHQGGARGDPLGRRHRVPGICCCCPASVRPGTCRKLACR